MVWLVSLVPCGAPRPWWWCVISCVMLLAGSWLLLLRAGGRVLGFGWQWSRPAPTAAVPLPAKPTTAVEDLERKLGALEDRTAKAAAGLKRQSTMTNILDAAKRVSLKGKATRGKEGTRAGGGRHKARGPRDCHVDGSSALPVVDPVVPFQALALDK